MKVVFRYKNGKEREMHERYAVPLSKMGYGSYMTRDMRAAEPKDVAAPVERDGLESLNEDELREIAKDRGVKVHHRAGPEKIINALREAE